MQIKRIYHPWWLWEEVSANMWGSVSNKELYLKTAIEFTGNHELYGAWMGQVVKEWKYSCEHNLSDKSQNRKAWVGHAACAMAFRCPEDIVRTAWGRLAEEKQILANMEAEKAIKKWESTRSELCQNDL